MKFAFHSTHLKLVTVAVFLSSAYAAADQEEFKSACRVTEIGSASIMGQAKQVLQTLRPLTTVVSDDARCASKSMSGLSCSALFAVSGASSTLSAVTIYPLDRLKVLKQSGIVTPTESDHSIHLAKKKRIFLGGLEAAGYGHYDPRKGVPHYVKNNLYGGLAPFTALNISTTGIIYPLHDIFQGQIKATLPDSFNKDQKERYSNALGGFGAAGVSNILNIPGYNYRNHNTLANVNGVTKYSPVGFAKDLFRNPKIGTHGLAIAPIYSTSVSAYYLLYSEFKKQMKVRRPKNVPKEEELTLFNQFVAAAAARTLVSGITHPADTVRILKQDKKESYVTLIHDQYKKGGIRSFFRALPVTTVRNAASTAISMTTYEAIKKHFEN